MDQQTTYIRYLGQLNIERVNKLIATVEQKLKEGRERFVLLLSSSGGSVMPAISAYNYLKGIPAEVLTFNFGGVSSTSLSLFCAGSVRFCVPRAIFLINGIGFNATAGRRFDEKSLGEEISGLKKERENICRIIADSTGRKLEDVEQDWFTGINLDAEQAKDYGLVHEIKTELFEKEAEVISIE